MVKTTDNIFIKMLKKLMNITQRISSFLKSESNNKLDRVDYISKKVLELAKAGVWEWDVKKQKGVWSDEIYNIFEVELGTDVSYDIILTKIHQDDRDTHRQITQDWLANKVTNPHYEYRIILHDGTIKYLQSFGETDFDSNGNAVTLRGLVQDITEQKIAALVLEERTATLSAIFNGISDAIVYTDTERQIVAINKGLTRIFGYSLEDIQGKTTSVLYENHEEYLRQGKLRFNLTAKQKSEPYNVNYSRKNKELFVGESLGTVVYSSDNEILGFIGVIRDITRRLKSESELQDKEEKLQKIQELDNIGILAGGIAHDFNNIMTSLFGNISLAKYQMSDADPSFKFLEKSEKSLERAKALTLQLLTFAKGGAPFSNDIELKEIVKETVEFDLSGSNVKPIFKFANGLWNVNVDVGQMQQVISNLTINADQAMSDGGILKIILENVVITDNLEPGLVLGKYINMKIIDEGDGIDDTIRSRIFDPYFSTKPEGSGLGLATVYSIVKRHSGHIIVESVKGESTSFSVFIPASEDKPLQYTASEKLLDNRHNKHNQKAKVLVMDDDEAILSLMSSLLEVNDIEVETVLDGEQAIETYKESLDQGEPFSIIIMDLTIPGGMGGKDAIKELKKVNPNVKCIVSSGYADDPIMANFSDYGFQGVITKPFLLDDILSIINKVSLENGLLNE